MDLLDHVVSHSEELVRDGNAKHPCGLRVNDELEFVRLHDGQVRGLRALEDETCIKANLTKAIHNVRSVADQPTGFGKVTQPIYCGEPMETRQMCELDTAAVQKRGGPDKDSIRPVATPSFRRQRRSLRWCRR